MKNIQALPFLFVIHIIPFRESPPRYPEMLLEKQKIRYGWVIFKRNIFEIHDRIRGKQY